MNRKLVSKAVSAPTKRRASSALPASTRSASKAESNRTKIRSVEKRPDGWWKDRKNQLAFVESLRSRLGLAASLDQLYQLTARQILSNGGVGLLSLYKFSPASIVTALYPSHKFLPWKFEHSKRGSWRSIEYQREFLEWARKELKLPSDPSCFYALDKSTVARLGGGRLMSLYKNSLLRLLSATYPNHTWLPWRFTKLPTGWWRTRENQATFIRWIMGQYNWESVEDLYRLTSKHIADLGGNTLLKMHKNSVVNVMKFVHPEHRWEESAFHQAQTTQGHLALLISLSYPGQNVVSGHKVAMAGVRGPGGTEEMELDLFVPGKHLAIEYQGERHYFDVETYGQRQQTLEVDAEKALWCAYRRLTLVEVPYWWQAGKSTLTATLGDFPSLETR